MNDNTEKIGLYLNIKIRTKSSDHEFDYQNLQDIKNIVTFIDESIYLVLTKDNDIIKIYQHYEVESTKKGEQILFRIQKDEDNSFTFVNPMPGINIVPKKKNVELLNKSLWYVLKSEPINPSFDANEDYYLNENDIIKLGEIKYIIKKINIRHNKENGIIPNQII